MIPTFSRAAPVLSALTIAASVGALVSACSTASYKAPVAAFANGASAAQSALIEIDKQESAGIADIHRQRAVEGRELVSLKKHDCTIGATRCRLTISDGSEENELTPEPALRNTIALMEVVNAYAKSLADIVAADTAEAVKGDVNATLGSAQDLAKTVHTLGGHDLSSATVPEFATPVGEAINWIIGNYVESVKFQGLKRATHDANPIIKELNRVVQEELKDAGFVQKRGLANLVSARLKAFDDSKNASNFDALVSAAAAYDRLLIAQPGDVFNQMAQAHDSLTNNLEGQKISLADVMTAIKTFETEAQDLTQIVQDLSQLENKKGGAP